MSVLTQTASHRKSRSAKRIVLTAIGSLGDLHPFLALGLGLKERGHLPIIATGECYRAKVEALGLPFRPLRPDSRFVQDAAINRRIMDYRWGTIRVLREVILPAIRVSYDDTLAVAQSADVLISHPLCFTVRLVAEKMQVPWVSTAITPLCFGSTYDPPLIPVVPDLAKQLRRFGPTFWGPLRRSLTWATRPWAEPIFRLRREIGLPPASDNPLVDGHSPTLVLATFSSLLARKQPDWPTQTVITGFPLFDHHGTEAMPPALLRFLDAGQPPIVFTLGYSAAMVGASFFEQSTRAAQCLGYRAVLVGGPSRHKSFGSLPDGVMAVDYAPFSQLFPRASVVVHAGGIGTSGLAMRAGRPMLAVPFAHDQPDNAARLQRLGIGRVIPRHRYTTRRAVSEIERLAGEQAFSRRATEVATQMRREDGVSSACDALESLLEATAS
jgi:rhamnosyltransferase subunit B